MAVTSVLRRRRSWLVVGAAVTSAAALTLPAGGVGSGAPRTVVPDLMQGLNAALFGTGEHEVGAPNRKGPYFFEKGKWTAAYGQYVEGVAAREAKATPTSTSLGSTWTNLGPTHADFLTNGYTLHVTDSGRLSNVVVAPDSSTIYVTAASGGIWKSTDTGQHWSAIGDNLPSLSIGALEMDPNNSSSLYLGLGDFIDGTGVGLLKSTDGGAHWSSPVFLGDSTVINDIAVAKGNSSIVVAATNRGLFRSTNAGKSFSAVSMTTGGTDAKPNAWSSTPAAPPSSRAWKRATRS